MSKYFRFRSALLAMSLAFATSTTTLAQDHDHDDHSHVEKAPQQEFAGDPYLLDTDPVTGEKLGSVEQQVIIKHEGRELRFTGEESVRAFRSDPSKVLAKIDEALVRQQIPFYPLKTCPVSGEKLGEMGEPVDLVVRNRLVRLCCKGCKKKVLADPGKYVTELDKAVVVAQGPKYPLSTCVVSGEELGGEMGEPIDYVIGNRLVRLCCKGCKKKIAKDPLSYLAKLDDSANPEHGHDEEGGAHGPDHGDDNHHHEGQR